MMRTVSPEDLGEKRIIGRFQTPGLDNSWGTCISDGMFADMTIQTFAGFSYLEFNGDINDKSYVSGTTSIEPELLAKYMHNFFRVLESSFVFYVCGRVFKRTRFTFPLLKDLFQDYRTNYAFPLFDEPRIEDDKDFDEAAQTDEEAAQANEDLAERDQEQKDLAVSIKRYVNDTAKFLFLTIVDILDSFDLLKTDIEKLRNWTEGKRNVDELLRLYKNVCAQVDGFFGMLERKWRNYCRAMLEVGTRQLDCPTITDYFRSASDVIKQEAYAEFRQKNDDVELEREKKEILKQIEEQKQKRIPKKKKETKKIQTKEQNEEQSAEEKRLRFQLDGLHSGFIKLPMTTYHVNTVLRGLYDYRPEEPGPFYRNEHVLEFFDWAYRSVSEISDLIGKKYGVHGIEPERQPRNDPISLEELLETRLEKDKEGEYYTGKYILRPSFLFDCVGADADRFLKQKTGYLVSGGSTSKGNNSSSSSSARSSTFQVQEVFSVDDSDEDTGNKKSSAKSSSAKSSSANDEEHGKNPKKQMRASRPQPSSSSAATRYSTSEEEEEEDESSSSNDEDDRKYTKKQKRVSRPQPSSSSAATRSSTTEREGGISSRTRSRQPSRNVNASSSSSSSSSQPPAASSSRIHCLVCNKPIKQQ